MNEVKTIRNTSIDSGRFIAAFLVVCLHTHFPINFLGAYIADIAKIAVPFFLMVSGFYLFSESEDIVLKRSANSIKKISLILLQAGIIYALLRIYKHYYLGIDISSQSFNLLPFLIFNDFNFTEHLWYVFAYLYDLIVIWFFCKLKRFKYLLYALPILILLYYVFTLWSRFISFTDGKFWFEFNWLVIGMPFVVTGMFLKKNFEWVNKINHKYLVVLIIIFFLLIFGEHYAFKLFVGNGPGVFSIQFLAIALFIYCTFNLSIFNNKLNFILSDLGKKHALNIYLYHILVREIITINNGSAFFNNSITIFAITLIISMSIESIKSFINSKLNLSSN